MWLSGVGTLVGDVLRPGHGELPPRPARRAATAETAHEQWRFQGLANLFFLAVVLGAVFVNHPPFLREALMVAAAAGSYLTTAKAGP